MRLSPLICFFVPKSLVLRSVFFVIGEYPNTASSDGRQFMLKAIIFDFFLPDTLRLLLGAFH